MNRYSKTQIKYLFITMALPFLIEYSYANKLPKCLYISSYHQGYIWSDGIEKGLKKVLDGKCQVTQFDMNTKKNKSTDYARKKALEVKALIKKLQPDAVITSDDNAAKYVIKAHFKNSNIPFIFCGVNWDATKYGFPFRNVTGMVEVAPIKALYKIGKKISKGNNVLFIGANNETERKDLLHFESYAKKNKIKLQSSLVNSMSEWMSTFKEAQNQQYDFIILGASAGLNGWNIDEVKKYTSTHTKILTMTTYKWMMPLSIFGLTIFPHEQGQWSAHTALAIINGYPISDIAITTNKTWDNWVNMKLLKSSGIKLPRRLIRTAKKIK